MNQTLPLFAAICRVHCRFFRLVERGTLRHKKFMNSKTRNTRSILTRHNSSFSLATAIAALCLLCGPVSGSILASDSFAIGADDYASGTTMDTADGQAGVGSGPLNMTGTWAHDGLMEGNADNVASTVNLRTTGTGLDFGTWDQGGGAVESFRTGSNTAGQYTPIHYRSLITGGQQIAGNTAVYFSALVNFTAGYGAGVGIEFDDRSEGSAREAFGVGVDGSGEAFIWVNTESAPSLDTPGSYIQTSTSGLGLSAGTTYMIVGKMTATAPEASSTLVETIELLGVFDVGSVASTEPSSLLSTTYDVYFDLAAVPEGKTLEAAYIWGGKSASGVQSVIDEVVIGTSFDSVVPVPEPASMALAIGLLSFVGLMLHRRNRRNA